MADHLSFGVVNLDKPPGPTAHQVAGWVRELVVGAVEREAEDGGAIPIHRAAHVGTLDPKVTGCLPVLLGDATRLVQAFDDARKDYVTVLELHGPAPADLRAVVGEFEGPLLQKPPRKSAVVRRLRTRTIHRLEVMEVEERRILLRVECQAGTYVRKLCHDLGLALGTGAHMGDLRRTRTGSFDDGDLATLHDLADALSFWADDRDPGPLREVVQPAERALRGLPTVTIARSAAQEVAEGAPVYAPGVLDAEIADTGILVACYTPAGTAVCLGRLVGDPEATEGIVVDLERVLV